MTKFQILHLQTLPQINFPYLQIPFILRDQLHDWSNSYLKEYTYNYWFPLIIHRFFFFCFMTNNVKNWIKLSKLPHLWQKFSNGSLSIGLWKFILWSTFSYCVVISLMFSSSKICGVVFLRTKFFCFFHSFNFLSWLFLIS